jgi:predicted RNase H-like HicB family nuclease
VNCGTASNQHKEQDVKPEDYLGKPYHWVLVPYKEGWHAVIAEFPGCIASGDTSLQALRRLERAAYSWLLAVIDKGQRVPDPWDDLSKPENT